MSRGARFHVRLLAELLPLVVALGLLLPGVAAVAGGPVAGSATLSVSRAEIVYGGAIHLTGAVRSGARCEGGREVRLQFKEPGRSTWSLVKTKTTSSNGAFDFFRQPGHSSAYRAVLPQVVTADTTCAAVTSLVRTNVVDARVSLSVSPNPLAAGACSKIEATVQPPKPGTSLKLQQHGSGGWFGLRSFNLDPSSHATGPACFGWGSIGTVDLRAVWISHGPLNASGTSGTVALRVVKAPWMQKIDHLTAGRSISVSVASGSRFLYERSDGVSHAPASNEKLLLSMAMLDRLGPSFHVTTQAAARSVSGGVVRGDLWILGHGDPEVSRKKIGDLAKRIEDAGIHRIDGQVMGAVAYFSHDWFAPGWKPEFPDDEIALPSALTFRHNQAGDVNVSDPERRAAAALTRALKTCGVTVTHKAGAGTPPGGLHVVAHVDSAQLRYLLRHMNVGSVNFFAEVLGKRLAVSRFGVPGTIAKGAAAIRGFAGAHGVGVVTYDSSGLSYSDRATAFGIVRLLGFAESSSWGGALKGTLAKPGEGTLEDRLAGVPMKAKTGTLDDISALSGWLLLKRTDRWARFSLLSSGFSASKAKDIEDSVVRTLWQYGR